MAPSIAELTGCHDALPVDSHPRTNGFHTMNGQSDCDVAIRQENYGTKKKMRIAMLGAGISGINFFKFAEQKLENVEIICYEKNHDIGGTWLENRYPGCACDIPSVVYQFPWRPAPWSKYYSHAPEIWDYIKMVEQENSFVEKYIKLQHKIMQVSWTDEASKWTLVIQNLQTGQELEDQVDIIIDGGGILNRWKWPDIEGLNDFTGDLLHSANWNQGCDLTNKRVALIGAGSSGVQILPNIYDRVSKVYTWVRNRIWITAGFAQAFAGKDGTNFIYNEEQRKLFSDSDSYLAYRKAIEDELNQRFSFIINGSKAQKAAREYSENEMKTLLKDRPDLLDKIMPTNFDVGCRRPTPGNGYLEALVGPKTTAYTEQIRRVTRNGFLDPDGMEHHVDVIICATGFDTSYSLKYPVYVNGVDMNEKWRSRDKVPSYLSLGYAEVPNYFVNGGAYCPSAHGSFFPIIQAYTDYEIEVITKMQVEKIRSLRPKSLPTEHFIRHANSFLKRTAWTGPCSSWFKGGKIEGNPVRCAKSKVRSITEASTNSEKAIYPGSRLHFLRLLEKPRYEDYDIDYEDAEDMFGFFGDGFHVCETDGSDISWYLGAPQKPVDLERVKEQMDGVKGIAIKR